MIRYALSCAFDHEFEAWFGSSNDFDDQVARGLVECPHCGSRDVKKQIMAPSVQGTKASLYKAEAAKALAEIRKKVEANCDYVGDRFADEARAIHLGDAEARGIYGEASLPEVKALIDEGIPVAPVPGLSPKPKTALN